MTDPIDPGRIVFFDIVAFLEHGDKYYKALIESIQKKKDEEKQ